MKKTILSLAAVSALLFLLCQTATVTWTRPLIEKGYFAFDPLLGWKLRADVRVVRCGESYFSTDSAGYRGTHPSQSDIIIAGDSFAQGYYLYDDETVAARLDRAANLGVGGYSTDQEYIALKEYMADHKTRHVVMLFVINDLPFLGEPMAWDMGKPMIRGDEIIAPVRQAIRENVPEPTIRRIARYINAFTLKRVSYQLPPNAYTDAAALADKWRQAMDLFVRCKTICETRGATFTVLFVPELRQILDGNRGATPQKVFVELCKASGVDYIEPLETFIEAGHRAYFVNDGHFSPLGAKLCAKVIKKHLGDLQ